MSGRDPIDFDSPLGISKREWTKVLGVNLALLLLAYAVALVCTLCGSDFFLLNFQNEAINAFAQRLNEWKIYPLVTIAFATVEEAIIVWFIILKAPKWWMSTSYFLTRVANNLLFLLCGASAVPSWSFLLINVLFCAGFVISQRKKFVKPLIRFGIAVVVTLALNELIALFRSKAWEINHQYSEAAFICLSIEYDLALVLTLSFLALLIPWRKGGKEECYQTADAGGSSPTMKKWSQKNSLTKNNQVLSHKARKKVALLKAKVIVIQTLALAVIAALPFFTGKPVEFSLLYVAFCLTRLILGFRHSLHFKSELACITIGALTFWALTYLAPSVDASIIMSLVYGACLALGFRMYWELHDLMMYRKAAKTDRYAMFYTAFKGNLDPRHIRGIMKLRGYADEDDIKMVQMYMAKEKVDYIAKWLNEPLRSVDRKLTEMAENMYSKR